MAALLQNMKSAFEASEALTNGISKDGQFRPYQIVLPLSFVGMAALYTSVGYAASIPFLICYLVWFFKSDIESNIVFLLAIQPFAALFKAGSQLPSFTVIFYFLLIVKALLFLKDNPFSRGPILSLMVMAFSFLMAIQLLNVIVVAAPIGKVVAFALNIALCVTSILALYASDSSSLLRMRSDVAICFPLAVAAMILVADMYPSLAYSVIPRESTFQTAGVIYDRFSGLAGDANYYSQLVLCAVALSLGDALVKGSKRVQFFDLIVTVFLIVQGARSYSKSYYITLFIVIVAFCILLGRRAFTGSKQKAALFIVCMPLLLGTVAVVAIELIMPGFMLRMETGQDISTGRFDIWSSYISGWLSNISYVVFGLGFDNARHVVGSGDAAHNAYLELFVELGLLGIICLAVIWAPALKSFKNIFNEPRVLYLVPLAVTCLGLALSDYDFVYLCISVLPCFRYLQGEEAVIGQNFIQS